MAVTQFNERKQEQEGSWECTGQRNYLRIFQCISDDPKDDSVTVLLAMANFLGIPIGSPAYIVYASGNGFDTFAKLKKMTARQEVQHGGEFKQWIVRLEYDSTAQEMQDNPLLRPTSISSTGQTYELPVYKDINGEPIINKANQYFSPLLPKDVSRWQVTFRRNEATWDESLALAYINTINATAWYGGLPQTWKCQNISGQGPNIENDVVFYTVTYEFAWQREGWQLSPLNAGLIDVNGKPIRDGDGDKVSLPWPLDDKGNALKPGYAPADCTFLAFDVYPTSDFNTLGLP